MAEEPLDFAPGEFPIDVGSGIRLREVDPDEERHGRYPVKDGKALFEMKHLCKTGKADSPERTAGFIAPCIAIGPGHHQLVSREPLTIRPSISCPSCGLHGYITDGVWKSC